jgi:hypothetical protein
LNDSIVSCVLQDKTLVSVFKRHEGLKTRLKPRLKTVFVFKEYEITTDQEGMAFIDGKGVELRATDTVIEPSSRITATLNGQSIVVCTIDGRVEKIRRRPLEKLQQDLESERNAAASATAQVEKLNKEIEGQVVEEQAERFDAKVKKLDWSYSTIEEEVKKAIRHQSGGTSSYNITITALWELLQCVAEELDDDKDLAPVLTITGSCTKAIALPCKRYMELQWGSIGSCVLEGICQAISDPLKTSRTCRPSAYSAS